jgi:RNA polymerase sigma-70 factor (ECF subfamily)
MTAPELNRMDVRDPKQVVDALFQEWAEPLFRHAYRLTRSRAHADDLVQEAFLCFYIELRRGVEIHSPRGWMLGLVSNRAAKVFRDSRRWEQADGAIDSLQSTTGEEEEDVASADDLLPLLKLLTPRETEVILLRLQAMKYREIAAQLGISAKSVGTLLARALGKLQDGVRKTGTFSADLPGSRYKDAPLQ